MGQRRLFKTSLQAGNEIPLAALASGFFFFVEVGLFPPALASQACCEVLMREGIALENDDHTKPQEYGF